jgi:CHAD domain-containing protein
VVGEARDAEGVHQLRVALRRLRAAMSAFGDAFATAPIEDLRARAKALADKFGATRELDVFASELLPCVEQTAATRPGLPSLRLALEGLREESWNDAVALVNSEGFTGFLLDLAGCAETRCWREDALPEQLAEFARPAIDLAREALDERDRKARKRAKHLARLETQERHRLRIALKKLRYSAEFFAPLFPDKDVGLYLKRLGKAQDDFGALNDAATAESVLHRIMDHAGPEAGADLREGVAFVAGWHESRVEPIWDQAKRRWKRFAKTEPFWN